MSKPEHSYDILHNGEIIVTVRNEHVAKELFHLWADDGLWIVNRYIGRLAGMMVGDEEEYCGSYGQIGCCHDGVARE